MRYQILRGASELETTLEERTKSNTQAAGGEHLIFHDTTQARGHVNDCMPLEQDHPRGAGYPGTLC